MIGQSEIIKKRGSGQTERSGVSVVQACVCGFVVTPCRERLLVGGGRKEGGWVGGWVERGGWDQVTPWPPAPPGRRVTWKKYANMEACNVGGNQIAHPTLP